MKRVKWFVFICAMCLMVAMSVTAIAAESPEWPDTQPYEDNTEEPTETETETESNTVKFPPKQPYQTEPNSGNSNGGNGNGGGTTDIKVNKSDTSPKTGEVTDIMYLVLAALACGGTAFIAKNRLTTEE
ncbi:MAG: hypothetical protein UDG86_04940 [Lachnospiraceae bacterium]|nr:hypothetical protein [Lachnospiraceae bacterium]